MDQQVAPVIRNRRADRARRQGDEAGQGRDRVDVLDFQRVPDETRMDVLLPAEHAAGHLDVAQQDVPQQHQHQPGHRAQAADARELAVQPRRERRDHQPQHNAQQQLLQREFRHHQEPEHDDVHEQQRGGDPALHHGFLISGAVPRSWVT